MAKELKWNLYEFTSPAITRYHRLGGLDNRNAFSHTSGVQKCKIKALAGFV